MSFLSIKITRLISGKETREYPLGYFAFESLFVLVKGASILVLLLMALYSNISVLLSGGREPVLGLLTVRLDPRDDEIKVDDFMKVKVKLSEAAREVYENTQTEVLLERN